MEKYLSAGMRKRSALGQLNVGKEQSRDSHKDKLVSMAVLFTMAAAIVLSGIAYSIYSAVYKTSFHVLNTDLPGYILGIIAIFLGARYIKAVIAFGKKLDSSGNRFSWKNFKKKR